MMNAFRRMGLQKRIMLFVVTGLVVMFGGFIFLGLRSIQQATDMVYEERLNTAYATAGLLVHDFNHVFQEVEEDTEEILRTDRRFSIGIANGLLARFSNFSPSPFFRVTGVWVMDDRNQLVEQAGVPRAQPDNLDSLSSRMARAGKEQMVLFQAVGDTEAGIPFVTLVARLGAVAGRTGTVVVLHTVSVNSPNSYNPISYWDAGSADHAHSSPPREGHTGYHLEVVSPQGVTLLGMGEDEHPGQVSRHFSMIESLAGEGAGGTILHTPGPGQSFRPHIVSAVPLTRSGLYVILEQPADIALGLPSQLRQGLITLSILGFLSTLLVAWITTRHVVKPTEQLTTAAQRMAQGDLNTPIDISAQDEIGNLAQSLETMRRRLRDALSEVETANRELGSRVQERTRQLHELVGRVFAAQEEERRRVALGLHDETAQALTALSVTLDSLKRKSDRLPPEIVMRLHEARKMAADTLEGVRRLMYALRPLALKDMGLAAALRRYAEEHIGRSGAQIQARIEDAQIRLPERVELTLYRIGQEALNNVARHAQARNVWITITYSESRVTLIVRDDGVGFDPSAVSDARHDESGLGLAGMRERASLVGGSLSIDSAHGKGTLVTAQIPLPYEAN